MKKSIIIVICILIIIGLGIYFGISVFNKNNDNDFVPHEDLNNTTLNNQIKASIEVSNSEEKTTPKTLIIYKTYYTKSIALVIFLYFSFWVIGGFKCKSFIFLSRG